MPEVANVCLIGFMGTGKSTVGGLLAGFLGWKLRDTDREIELDSGLSVRDIFAYYGEDYFRYLEAAVLRRLTTAGQQVIATGGGAVLSEENRRLIRETGPTVLLEATTEAILARTAGSHDRPLLETSAVRERIMALLAQRQRIYDCLCDFKVDTTTLAPAEVASRIMAWLREATAIR